MDVHYEIKIFRIIILEIPLDLVVFLTIVICHTLSFISGC